MGYSSTKCEAPAEWDVSLSKSLRPTTSVLTTRYQRRSRVDPVQTQIAAGLLNDTQEEGIQCLPKGWSSWIGPEGQRYFVFDSTIRVVTEDYLYSSDVQDKITFWINEFNNRLETSQICVPASAELFLALDDKSDSCLYYLVDYATCVEFWIEKVDTEDLDMMPAVSTSHLRLQLKEHFWTHVEQFPCHSLDRLLVNRAELIQVFLHARNDQLTSASSTFCYSAKQCADFLELLDAAECATLSSCSVAMTARLWAVVFYGAHWQAAMAPIRDEWIFCTFLGFAITMVDIMSFLLPGTWLPMALASTLLSVVAIVSAVSLLVKYQEAIKWEATDAAEYLAEAARETTGFQWTALVLSLPRASLLWALGLFSLQGFFWLLEATNSFVVGGVMVAICAIVLCSQASRLSFAWLNVPSGALLREDCAV
ncbi:predicted protein [Postia placenta Mad-698-R]|nr:predicted protein [Postia placenta Mad-698-R]